MPIYETVENTREKLEKLRKTNVCKECGGWLNMFLDVKAHEVYLACNDFHRTHHEGIMRPASQYQQEGMAALTIEARRETMKETFGQDKTKALEKYQGVTSLTLEGASEILEAIWPGAPRAEKKRAAILCQGYQLNPLMKHIFLVPFNKGKPNESWATVMGISATRLLASRSGAFGYVDDTPRVMGNEEQEKIFGSVDLKNICVVVKVNDPKTGAEAPGYGKWPKAAFVYGEDKGNSAFNMASIRAERQALSRLKPGEMPTAIEVIDEKYTGAGDDENIVDGTFKDVAEPTPAVELHEPLLAAETMEPTPEPEPRPETVPHDERPVTTADINILKEMMKAASLTPTDMGLLIANELKYKGVAKFTDLKKWQYAELIKRIKTPK